MKKEKTTEKKLTSRQIKSYNLMFDEIRKCIDAANENKQIIKDHKKILMSYGIAIMMYIKENKI